MRAALLPEQKVEAVRELQVGGHRFLVATAAMTLPPWPQSVALRAGCSDRPPLHAGGNIAAAGDVKPVVTTRDLTAEQFNDTINGNDVVLVDFWASWCGPCRAFAPTFQASSEKHPDIVYAKVDTEAERELAAAAQIRSIPTLMAFKKGKLVFNQPGALPPAALEDLVRQVKDFDVDAAIAASERDQA